VPVVDHGERDLGAGGVDREDVGAQFAPAERPRRPKPLEAVYDLELDLLRRENRVEKNWPALASERCMRATALASHSRSELSRSPSASTGTMRSVVSPCCTVRDWSRSAAATGGWRVTGWLKKQPTCTLSQRLRWRRVARDNRHHAPVSVPANCIETRMIAGNRRTRLARDRAIALSHEIEHLRPELSRFQRRGWRVTGLGACREPRSLRIAS
jgi:hypothetical protein